MQRVLEGVELYFHVSYTTSWRGSYIWGLFYMLYYDIFIVLTYVVLNRGGCATLAVKGMLEEARYSERKIICLSSLRILH
jgi:hypothetical protein